jgi:hypothetical protein
MANVFSKNIDSVLVIKFNLNYYFNIKFYSTQVIIGLVHLLGIFLLCPTRKGTYTHFKSGHSNAQLTEYE